MSAYRRRRGFRLSTRRYQPPAPPASVSRPDLAPLAEELLTRRTQEVTTPSPLGAYGLRRCADELVSHALSDARVDIVLDARSGWGIAILPRTA